MPKCEREDYNEPPFFYIDQGSDTPFAVAWLPLKLGESVLALLRRWPKMLQIHLEVLDDDFVDVEFEAFGDTTRDQLVTVLEKHRETAFADGGIRFRVWRRESDRESCLGIDEHGVLYIWEEPASLRKWLTDLGAVEREAPLISEADHDHRAPEDADLKRNAFVKALGLEEV